MALLGVGFVRYGCDKRHKGQDGVAALLWMRREDDNALAHQHEFPHQPQVWQQPWQQTKTTICSRLNRHFSFLKRLDSWESISKTIGPCNAHRPIQTHTDADADANPTASANCSQQPSTRAVINISIITTYYNDMVVIVPYYL